MTCRCVLISALLLAHFQEASFILCSNQPKMLQQVFLMSFHFFPPQPYPQSYLQTNSSASVPILHRHSSGGQLGEKKQPWVSPAVPLAAVAVLMSCLLAPARASAHVQPCVQLGDCNILQIAAPGTELKPQPLISALQNMSLGRRCYEVARLYQK